MSEPFRYRRRVEFRDTDAAGIVHFSVYFNYMEEAEHALLRESGVNVIMQDEDGEFSFPRVAVHCDYRAPLHFGDVVDIDVSVERLGSSSVTYCFDLSSKGEDIATGRVTVVCCRLAEGQRPRSMPIPKDFAETLATLVRPPAAD